MVSPAASAFSLVNIAIFWDQRSRGMKFAGPIGNFRARATFTEESLAA